MNDISESSQPVSRRERRELERSQQRNGQAAAGRRRTLRRIGLWTLGLALLAGIGWGMVKLADDVKLPSADGTLTVPVSGTDNIIGPASASVTLVEYSDFQCPACAAFHPLVKRLLTEPELQGNVRFVYRHFPLPMHKNARLAAQSAQAAAVQGMFWDMHDLLFARQQNWQGLSGTGAREAFMEYARELGMNTDQFAGDLDSAQVKAKIEADLDSGLASGVNATPTFFVNGTRMPQVSSYEEFKAVIAASVPAAATPNATP